jgi:hypothetical protein
MNNWGEEEEEYIELYTGEENKKGICWKIWLWRLKGG